MSGWARWESISACCSRPCLSRCRCLKTKSCAAAPCHAFNTYTAELFRDYSYRLTPVACIPMHTPREAIAELEHAKALGLKAVMLSGLIGRQRSAPADAGSPTMWRAPLALDSDYDYDPVWAKCLELKLAPTFHASSQGIGLRTSPSN